MNRFWVVIAILSLIMGPAGAASPDPQTLVVPPHELSRAQQLVQKLGSDLFREREKAQEELASMGRLARRSLIEAVNTDPSPEVRARSARLLPRAEAAELQARIDTFLADTEGKFDHDLPGWAAFRKLSPLDKDGRPITDVRGLYTEMLKNQNILNLLTALDSSPAEGGQLLADLRLNLFYQLNPQIRMQFVPNQTVLQPQQPTLAEVTALLYAEIAISGKDVPRMGPFSGITAAWFIQQGAARAALTNAQATPHSAAFRQILSRWLDTRTSAEDLASSVHIAPTVREFKEATPFLHRVATTEGVHGTAKGQAMIYLVQWHGKDEHKLVKSMFKSELLVSNVFLGQAQNGGARFTPCQLRDVALALMIVQSGQTIKDYGYQSGPGPEPNPLQNPYPTYAFPTDEDREKAFKKWAAWEAANEKKDSPKK